MYQLFCPLNVFLLFFLVNLNTKCSNVSFWDLSLSDVHRAPFVIRRASPPGPLVRIQYICTQMSPLYTIYKNCTNNSAMLKIWLPDIIIKKSLNDIP